MLSNLLFENMNFIEGLSKFEGQVPSGLLQDMERMATLLDVPGRLVDRFGIEIEDALSAKTPHLEVPLLAEDVSGQLRQVMDLRPDQREALTERAHRADSPGFAPGLAPRTLPKTMNEIFGAVPQFVVDGDILQWGEDGLIDQTIIRGASLTKTALNALGLPLPDSRLRVDQMDERHAQASAVREMFKNGLEPLGLPHEELDVPGCSRFYRLFRVTEGPRKGMIFGTRREKKDQLIPFGTDLNSALRQLGHIKEGYTTNDLTLLLRMDGAIRTITNEVVSDWAAVRDSGKLEKIESDINEMADGLSENLRNEHKQIIKRHFEGCRTFIDNKGKLNPNAHLCRLNVARGHIGERLGQIKAILNYHEDNSRRLRYSVRDENARVASFYRTVERGKDGFDSLLDTSKPLGNRAAVLEKLASVRSNLERAQFEPYLSFADEIIGNILMIEDLLGDDELSEAQRQLVQKAMLESYTLTRLIRLERGVADIVKTWKGGAGYMLGRLNRVIEQLSEHRVAPEVRTDRFNVLYLQAKHSIIGIRDILRQAHQARATSPERAEELKEEARTLLNEFSVAKMLKSIS
jgi:hypothetical protein